MYRIKDTCAGCHNCYSECPMQAIEWYGNQYQIDPDRCVKCGLCARECQTGSIYDDEFDYSVPAHDLIEKNADVVVCGAGTGLVAAVRAAQQGKKVIVLEKSTKIGGNTDYAHAFFPIYTKWHEEAGMADVREEAIEHYLEITDHWLDPDVVRTAVYAPGECFDWLCTLEDVHQYYELFSLGDGDPHGPIFGPGIMDYTTRKFRNLNCRDDSIGPGWGGTFAIHTMLKTIEEQNLPVEIYMEHAAEHLILDDAGRICGVEARDPGGLTRINTPTVVLATGGFGRSDEKLQEFAPWFFQGESPYHRFSMPTDTGDAIDMLREYGVEPDPERIFISHFGPKHHPFSNALADLALDPRNIQVNYDGERWTTEENGVGPRLFIMTQEIQNQPKQKSWAIQGREVMKMIADEMIHNPAFAHKAKFYETWEEELIEEANLPIPPCACADTIEELAEKIGMPIQALKKTVSEYNEYCASGKDDAFGKDPSLLIPVPEEGPYYAIMGQRFSEAALGGLMVDGKCRVLRNDGSFIPGLYGVGDATSAMHRRTEMAVISENTWAMASSFTSGNEASAYVDAMKGGEASCG